MGIPTRTSKEPGYAVGIFQRRGSVAQFLLSQRILTTCLMTRTRGALTIQATVAAAPIAHLLHSNSVGHL